MKGVELPINVLVIVAIAVIVLLGIIALYFAGFGPAAGQVNLQTATSAACGSWRARGSTTVSADTITISSFDANGDGTITAAAGCGGTADNLETLGVKYYGTTACSTTLTATDTDIRTRVCGLP